MQSDKILKDIIKVADDSDQAGSKVVGKFDVAAAVVVDTTPRKDLDPHFELRLLRQQPSFPYFETVTVDLAERQS